MSITDGTDLIDPRSYEAQGTPHRTFTELRRSDPLPFCEPNGFENFWAVTRHADICEISKQPNLFLNSKGIVILDDDQQISRDEGIGAMRTIIEMDPPEHVTYRKVTSAWFTPRALGRLNDLIENSARHLVDSLAGPSGDGECDYAIDVAAAHPLRILCSVLGVPREEEGRVLRLTNQLFAADDPELQRSAEDRNAAMRELGFELFEFFSKVIEDRRANPRDDLASIIANAKIGDEPMGPMETFGYCLIIFTAGHDTTKNALVGAMEAFLNNPEQLDRLRSGGDEVIDSAVEESVRWVTPVNYMKRNAARETTLRGRTIAEGDQLVLGPFQGPVACTRLHRGRGVCAEAWSRNEAVLVDDVGAFPGHVACSPESRSELVLPVRDASGAVRAVFDIDSARAADFNQEDALRMQRLIDRVADQLIPSGREHG